MRILFLLILFLSFSALKAQPAADFESVYKELNTVFKGHLPSVGEYSLLFTVKGDSCVTIEKSNRSLPDSVEFNASVVPAILKHKSIFKAEQWYKLRLFFDVFSDVTYAVVQPIAIPEDSVFGPHEFYPEPRGGFMEFSRILAMDILRNEKKIQWTAADSVMQLLVLVKWRNQRVDFLGDQRFESLLDSARLIKWMSHLEFGIPANVLLTFNLNTKLLFADDFMERMLWRDFVTLEKSEKVLPNTFQGSYVKRNNRPFEGMKERLLVSLVCNPLTNILENPIIHKGSTQEANDLIDFIRANEKELKLKFQYDLRYFFYL
ncbi:hypothetical protein [Sphingobacterium sp. MYb382]|uniref:hypothetical protein n=1 Tax=Sphingobacterium sp. MYb382 TaxID=2745278 RepID=UPI0030A5F838